MDDSVHPHRRRHRSSDCCNSTWSHHGSYHQRHCKIDCTPPRTLTPHRSPIPLQGWLLPPLLRPQSCITHSPRTSTHAARLLPTPLLCADLCRKHTNGNANTPLSGFLHCSIAPSRTLLISSATSPLPRYVNIITGGDFKIDPTTPRGYLLGSSVRCASLHA